MTCRDSLPRIHQGFAFSQELAIVDVDGDAIDLTNKTITAEARDEAGGTLQATFVISNTTLLTGLIAITLDAPGSAACTVGRYYFDVVMIEAGEGTIVTEPQEILVVDTLTAPA